MNEALAQFGRQSGLQVTYQPSVAAAKQSPGVVGRTSPEAAIARILRGSGLSYGFTNSRTVAISRAGATDASGAADGSTQLETINVDGENAWGAVDGYIAKRSATATKTDTPLIETPQSIQVVTADQIKTTKAMTLRQGLAYTPGIGAEETPGRNTVDTFSIRGFRTFPDNFYRDGTRFLGYNWGGQIEPYGLERIEVIKGASSVLYGLAAPGGIVNTVSKLPTEETIREVNVEYGTQNHKQVSADFSGRLTDDGVWTYRMTGLARGADTFTNHIPDDRLYLAPALTWSPDDTTSLTLLGSYQHNETIDSSPLPLVGTLLPNPNGKIPRSNFLGDPNGDRYESDVYSLGYIFSHEFSENLTFRSSARYNYADAVNNFTLGFAFDPTDMRTLYRTSWDSRFDLSTLTIDNNLTYKWELVGVENKTLIGMDYTHQKLDREWFSKPINPIDAYDPGTTITGIPTPSDVYSWRKNDKRIGIYLQNQAKIDERWVVLAGLRQDWTNDRFDRIFSDSSQHDNQQALTARAGLVYLFDNGFAPFISYSQSFEPKTGLDRLGKAFKPVTGDQYEVGLRYLDEARGLYISTSFFDLTQKNAPTVDPADFNFEVQTGKIRSRGIEVEAKVEFDSGFSLIGGYSYIDANILESNYPSEVGRRTGGTPEHQFSLWGGYDLGIALGVEGLKAGAGVRYVGETLPYFAEASIPAHTTVDAMVSYETGNWRLALNATNLFNKDYIEACTFACYYGEGRKVMATASVKW